MAKNLELAYLLDFYGDVLTDKQRDVMEQYYNEDLSLAEIAENFGITRQGVRDSIKRGEGILLDLEAKVGFAARHRDLQQKMNQLSQLAREIDSRNNAASFNKNEDIAKITSQMLEIIESLAEE